MQKPLIEPYKQPDNRSKFWHDYSQASFDWIAKKYGDYSIVKEYKWKLKAFIRRKMTGNKR